MIYETTGSKAMAVNFNPSFPAKIENVLIHLSAAATAAVNLTISKYSTNTAYNAVLLTQAMASVADVHYTPEYPVQINKGEKLQLAWVNDASSYKTWGVQIQYRDGV